VVENGIGACAGEKSDVLMLVAVEENIDVVGVYEGNDPYRGTENDSERSRGSTDLPLSSFHEDIGISAMDGVLQLIRQAFNGSSVEVSICNGTLLRGINIEIQEFNSSPMDVEGLSRLGKTSKRMTSARKTARGEN
jgi:hypothetical protein